MLVAALLWYCHFRTDLEGQGFEMANCMVDGKQHTVQFHVDDLMASHVNPKVNDKFLVWLNSIYGKYGEVKATRGKVHDYLGMVFDFFVPGKVSVSMKDYMNKLVDEFPFEISDVHPTPASEDLFQEGKGPLLDKEKSKVSHSCQGIVCLQKSETQYSPYSHVVVYLCEECQ